MRSKTSNWRRALAFLTIGGLFVTACGGSGDSESSGAGANDVQTTAEGSVGTASEAGSASRGGGDTESVEIAVVTPTSGAYAQSGTLMLNGMELARDEINAAGGIEALGGAEIVLNVEDAGDSVESASSAANRAVSTGSPVAGIGAYASSFTLGVTEVAERAQLPWLTQSYSDQITDRGFEYVFQTSLLGSSVASEGLSAYLDLVGERGTEVERVAIVGDNTAAVVSIFDPIRETIAEELGLEVVANEVYTPPLTDASSISSSLDAADPDLILFGATNFSDASLVLSSNEQFGVDAPYLAMGSWIVLPDYLDGLGAESIDGIVTVLGHPLPFDDSLRENFSEATGELFMTPDAVSGYYHVWLIKEALERAGTADPEAVHQALKEIDLTEGPAALNMVDQRVRFDEAGRRIDTSPIIAQWQDGLPQVIWPSEVAQAELR